MDEPGSHGFFEYEIRPKNTLVLGDEIKSKAYIYFDYNPAIITNLPVTRVWADLVAPNIVRLEAADNATNVAVNTDLLIEFNEEIRKKKPVKFT